MSILLLGGTGFIGFNLKRYLNKKRGINITIASSSRNRSIKTCDIRDPKNLAKIVKNNDVIVNLVGISGASASLAKPQETLATNTIGQLNLLEAVRKNNKNAKVIFISSRLEYGPVEKLPVDEKALFKPNSLYGISKYTATKYTQMYYKLYNLKTVVLRVSNPFGPQERKINNSYNIVNNFISGALNKKKLTVFGKGSQKRDYLFVDDVCEAIWLSIKKREAFGKIINIGGGKPMSINDMAKLIVSKVGSGKIVYRPWSPDWKSTETGDFLFSNKTAFKLLAWKPKFTIEEGVKQTIILYKKYESR